MIAGSSCVSAASLSIALFPLWHWCDRRPALCFERPLRASSLAATPAAELETSAQGRFNVSFRLENVVTWKEDASWFAAFAPPVQMNNCDDNSADLADDNPQLRALDLQAACSVFPVHLYQDLYADLHESARWTIHYQNVEQCLDATAEILAAGSRCVRCSCKLTFQTGLSEFRVDRSNLVWVT